MKRFIVIISVLFCMSLSQDIAGNWTLTAVKVDYYNYTRPNQLTEGSEYINYPDGAGGTVNYQYYTPVNVYTPVQLGGKALPITWMPPGYMFLEVPNGPFGEVGLATNGVNLNVNLATDGSGTIPEGSTYPDIELDEENCTTFGQVLPVTDLVGYTSTLDSGSQLPLTQINGRPSANPYAGETMGSLSLNQSVVFSFFPETPVPDYTPLPLFFSATEFASGPYPTVINGVNMYETAGVTGGWIKRAGQDGHGAFSFDVDVVDDVTGDTTTVTRYSIGQNDPTSAATQPQPDLALYWHSIDGFSADTGLGDSLSVDEDGDGTPYDRIFGLPAISASRVDAGCAAAFGFGDSFDYMVAGDITEAVAGLVEQTCEAMGLQATVYGGCLSSVSAACEAVTAGQVEEQCDQIGSASAFVSYFAALQLSALAAAEGLTLEQYVGGGCQLAAATDACANGASGLPDELCGAGGFAQEICLGFGFSESACGFDADDPDTADENEQGLANLVVNSGITDCADLAANVDTLTAAAGSLVDTVDEDDPADNNCDEWAVTVADGFAAQSAATGYNTCTELADGLAAQDADIIAVLDAMAAGSESTNNLSCTDYTAYLLGNNLVSCESVGTSQADSCIDVTLSDDYEETADANSIYVMNPSPAFLPWNGFVTYNSYMFTQTGVNNGADYAWDLDLSEVYWLDANTFQSCQPGSSDACGPVSFGSDGIYLDDPTTDEDESADNGGRIVFSYEPTCIPVLESMEVQTEFVGFAEGECNHDGDVTGNSAVDVLDVVALVSHVVGNSTLEADALCRADINEDSTVNVLDIVGIVNIIVNSRGDAATDAEFIRDSEGLEMNANGVVDAVQITLSHSNDFSIELTDDALIAEYSTKDNQTTLIVVLPEDGRLFSATGEYTIDEVIAANEANGYITTSMPVTFNLSEAYPNPFNPSTNLDIELNNTANVSVMVYNVMGQMVSVLHDGNMNAGMHSITWDASNLSSGMYIIKAEVAGDVSTQKVMLLK